MYVVEEGCNCIAYGREFRCCGEVAQPEEALHVISPLFSRSYGWLGRGRQMCCYWGVWDIMNHSGEWVMWRMRDKLFLELLTHLQHGIGEIQADQGVN